MALAVVHVAYESMFGCKVRTQVLHPKCVGGLDVQVCGVPVLLFTAAEESKPGTCTGQRLVGLRYSTILSEPRFFFSFRNRLQCRWF